MLSFPAKYSKNIVLFAAILSHILYRKKIILPIKHFKFVHKNDLRANICSIDNKCIKKLFQILSGLIYIKIKWFGKALVQLHQRLYNYYFYEQTLHLYLENWAG